MLNNLSPIYPVNHLTTPAESSPNIRENFMSKMLYNGKF